MSAEPSTTSPHFVVLLDIDNTLYRYSDTSFADQMHENIYTYVMKHFHLSLEEANFYSKLYYENYGLSLLGFYKAFGQPSLEGSPENQKKDFPQKNETNDEANVNSANNNNTSNEGNTPTEQGVTDVNPQLHTASPSSKNETRVLMNAKDYSDYVHCNVTYENLTNSEEKREQNRKLKEMLIRLNLHVQSNSLSPEDAAVQKKGNHPNNGSNQHYLYYFTNANRQHAINCLTHLGIISLFRSSPTVSNTAEEPKVYSPIAKPFKEYTFPFEEMKKKNEEESSHPSHDVIKAEDASEGNDYYFGFSYEDQWRLTEPDIHNKPFREAYAAIQKEVSREVKELEAYCQNSSTADTPTAEAVHTKYQQLFPTGATDASNPSVFVMVDDTLMNLHQPLALQWRAVWLDQIGNSKAILHSLEDSFKEDLPSTAEDESPKKKQKEGFLTSFNEPFYQEAYQNKQLKIIYDILELETALKEFVEEEKERREKEKS